MHEEACGCQGWPEECVSSLTPQMWDTAGWATGIPAVIGMWETLRAAGLREEVSRLRAQVPELEQLALGRVKPVPYVIGEDCLPDELSGQLTALLAEALRQGVPVSALTGGPDATGEMEAALSRAMARRMYPAPGLFPSAAEQVHRLRARLAEKAAEVDALRASVERLDVITSERGREIVRARTRVTELEQIEAALLRLLPTEPCPQEGPPVELAQEQAWHGVWELVADVLGVTLPYARPVDEDPITYTVTAAGAAAVDEEPGKVSRDAAGITRDFFQVGHVYARGQDGFKAPEQTTVFYVEHVSVHPDRGLLRAIGWSRSGESGADWHGDFQDEGEFAAWEELPVHFAPVTAVVPVGTTAYRAEYEHVITPLRTYTTRAAARRHCWTEARQEEARERSGAFDLVWKAHPGGEEVEELWVGTGPDGMERTGYFVTAVAIAADYNPEAGQ